jgi:hypothetical protein
MAPRHFIEEALPAGRANFVFNHPLQGITLRTEPANRRDTNDSMDAVKKWSQPGVPQQPIDLRAQDAPPRGVSSVGKGKVMQATLHDRDVARCIRKIR